MSGNDMAHERDHAVARDERARRCEAAVRDSPAPVICISNERGRYVFVNQAFADLIGRPLTEVMTSDPYEVWIAISSPEEFERQRREARRVGTGEIAGYQMDLHVKPANGEPRPVRLTVVPGEIRPVRPGLVGSTSVAADVAGQVFDTDLDIVWPTARRYAHVPAGEPVPDIAGQAVVRHLG